VESEAQRQRLLQMQCPEIQGYYCGAPVSAHDATQLLGRHHHGVDPASQRAAG
jgi:EAL domain-containing protein (putative c-di-GMP-specific phosphodiesterase class I)